MRRSPFANDDGDFEGKGRIVGQHRRIGQGQDVAVAVLVLQPFAGQGRAPGRGPSKNPRAWMSPAAQIMSPMRWKPNME
jgi:hypothetical protein